MSRSFVASHFPTSPVVPIGFLVLCFFMFLSVPLCFPFLLFPPLISLHFLAFPLCSPVFSAKKTRVFQRFRKEDVNKTQSFSRLSAKGGRKSKPAKSRQGYSSLGPLFCAPRRLRLVERHQITARFVGTPPSSVPCVSDVGRGVVRGGYPLSSIGVRHAEQCRRIFSGKRKQGTITDKLETTEWF